MTPKLISYTLPCHKREADLLSTLPTVIAAANASPPVEILIVDYGHPETLETTIAPWRQVCASGVTLWTVRVEAEYFHMAHARNVGIRHAVGGQIIAFLADLTVVQTFFAEVRRLLEPGIVLKYEETFAFNAPEILEAGGFDERFEFYGPEGKELADRLQRRGLVVRDFAPDTIGQIRTGRDEKVRNYRLKLTKSEMHQAGMVYWRENQINEVTVANQGRDWGQIMVPTYA